MRLTSPDDIQVDLPGDGEALIAVLDGIDPDRLAHDVVPEHRELAALVLDRAGEGPRFDHVVEVVRHRVDGGEALELPGLIESLQIERSDATFFGLAHLRHGQAPSAE